MSILHLSGVLAFTTAAIIDFHSDAQKGQVLAATPSTATQLGTDAQGRQRLSEPTTERSWEMLPAQFQATVYEVQGAPEQLRSLDEKALASQADTPEALLSALTQVGKVACSIAPNSP